MPVQEWESVIDGNHYQFKCEQDKAFTYTIKANDESVVVKGGFLTWIFGFDESFTIAGKEMRLLATRQGMDVAYDGHFLISGKPYIPRPAWVWVFVVICISLVFMGGMLGGAIGFIGSAVCLSASRTDTPTFMRIGVCVFVTILTWALLIMAANTFFGG